MPSLGACRVSLLPHSTGQNRSRDGQSPGEGHGLHPGVADAARICCPLIYHAHPRQALSCPPPPLASFCSSHGSAFRVCVCVTVEGGGKPPSLPVIPSSPLLVPLSPYPCSCSPSLDQPTAESESWSWRLKPAATRGQQSQRLGHSPVPRPWSWPGAERGSREGRGRTRRRPCACQAAHAQPFIRSGVLHPLFWGVLRGQEP